MILYQEIFIVPGEKGTLTGKTLKEAVWSGKGFYGDLARLTAINAPLDASIKELFADYQK